MRRLLPAIVLLALALAGCGEDPGDTSPAAQPPAATGPEGPPPSVGQGPPPAWVETEAGSFWLDYSTYCWTSAQDGGSEGVGAGLCADYVVPSCDGPSAATEIPVRDGELATFHLGFDPAGVHVGFVESGRAELQPSRAPTWTVDGLGAFILFATVSGGDASYAACLVSGEGSGSVSGAQTPDEALTVEEALASGSEGPLRVKGSLFAVEGESVRLCDAIAESYPPQCGGASLVVEELDLATVPALQTAGGVSWAEGVELLGTVAGGVLSVSTTAR